MPTHVAFAAMCRNRALHIGSVLLEQMVHITDLVEASVGSSASLEMQLATANQELRRSLDRETIRVVVETPVRSVKSAEDRAYSFQQELKHAQGVLTETQRGSEACPRGKQ